VSAITEDGFLNGRLRVRQPRRGFRAGLDAVMLAAAVPAGVGEMALELGAGVGTASLCLAARSGCDVTGIEIEPELVDLANQNAALNEVSGRVRFEIGDALNLVLERTFDHVFCNPPFHDDSGQRSSDVLRARALQDAGTLKNWVRNSLDHVASKGSFTIILRANRLGEVLEVLPQAGVYIFPLLPHAGEPPKRVIVQWRQTRRGRRARLQGLVLHQTNGRYTPEADTLLRDAVPLRISS